MSTNYVQLGRRVQATNGTGSAVSSGDAVLFGDTLRIAVHDIANGSAGEWEIEGVFTIAATTADTWSDGDFVYWNDTTSKLTSTMGSNTRPGIAIGAKTNGQTTAVLKLWPGSTPSIY